MEQLNPYIFYQTQRSVGFCNTHDRQKYKYENNINPTVISLTNCTQLYINELLDLFKKNKNEFIEHIKKDMSEDEFAIFSS